MRGDGFLVANIIDQSTRQITSLKMRPPPLSTLLALLALLCAHASLSPPTIQATPIATTTSSINVQEACLDEVEGNANNNNNANANNNTPLNSHESESLATIDLEDDHIALPHFTTPNLNSPTLKMGLAIVLVYSGTCAENALCVDLKHDFDSAATKLKREHPNVALGYVNATADADAAKLLQITQTPVVRILENGQQIKQKFHGERRDADAMLRVFRRVAAPLLQEVTSPTQLRALLSPRNPLRDVEEDVSFVLVLPPQGSVVSLAQLVEAATPYRGKRLFAWIRAGEEYSSVLPSTALDASKAPTLVAVKWSSEMPQPTSTIIASGD